MAKLSPGRKGRKTRDELRKLHVYSEGPTERHYFDGEKPKLRNTGWTLENHKDISGPAPKIVADVIKHIRARQGDFNPGDRVWVVFDYDIDIANRGDAERRLQEALRLAREYNKDPVDGIELQLAISNDAFELWAALHFQDIRASTSRDALEGILSDHLGHKYDKPEPNLHRELERLGDVEQALQRAERLNAKNGFENPSTGVADLIREINRLANRKM